MLLAYHALCTHVQVVAEDSCYKIATSNNLTLASLQALNPGLGCNATSPYVGQVLCIGRSCAAATRGYKQESAFQGLAAMAMLFSTVLSVWATLNILRNNQCQLSCTTKARLLHKPSIISSDSSFLGV